MLRIGDFSQLAQVSVPALRHYDEMGLLRPTHVDPFTDYRYYTVEQLPRLNRILALKDLGLSLDQIRGLLEADVPVSKLRGLLATKRAEIEQQITTEQARLQRVEARLEQIEHEGSPSPYEVVIKKVPALTVAGVRQIVPHVSHMEQVRAPALTALYSGLRAARLDGLIENELMLYHATDYRDDEIDMEAAAVLNTAALKKADHSQLPEAIRVHTLPAAATMASTVHHGVLWDIPKALIALFGWIGTSGYRSAGPIRELHLFGSEIAAFEQREDWHQHVIVELQVPVERETSV